jgi:DNA-binding GntR family transcriptional regulator
MSAAASNLTAQAYRHLHQQLVTGKLAAGAVLSEKKLAEELGISRTPVADAVRQLALEGLLEQVPRYGTIVREITRQDIVEIYGLREAIEPYAAREAAGRITASQIEQLRVLCHATRELAVKCEGSDQQLIDGQLLREFLAADMAFHTLVVRAAANSRILKVVQDSRAVSQIFRIRRRRHDSTVVHGACDYHEKIVAALESGDGDVAADWMLKHITQSKVETLAYIDQVQDHRLRPEAGFSLELSESVRAALEQLERQDPSST